jgi:hypothetical protein
VNTKADIRFSVGKADFLPDWVKNNLLQQARVLSSTQRVARADSVLRISGAQ